MNSRKNLRFSIILSKQTAKYIEKLSKKQIDKVLNTLEEMTVNPFSGDIETIKGKPSYYRRRIGSYRIKFAILVEKKEIRILEFGPKGDFSY